MGRRIKFLLITFIVLFILLQPYSFSGRALVKGNDDPAEINNVVRGAVEDTSWMKSSTPEQLRENLGKYFTGSLLEELSCSAWDFVRADTDWHWQAGVETCSVTVNEDTAKATVWIRDVEPSLNSVKQGKAEYVLLRTQSGWRITGVCYQWEN